MSLVRPQHWLFSIKAFLAGMLALAVAFWLDLPRPYWALATVYIASQPLAGATHSKAFFRAIGTLGGAAVAVLLVPNLVNAPPLLVMAVSLWSGLCLYLSILDRTPRSYAFMLAGYTTVIIGYPAVDAPGEIFDLALSRTEEILIGILSAALVSSLLFPQSVGPVVAERIARWLEAAKTAARDALTAPETNAVRSHWLRLAAETAEIENLAAHLPFEATVDRRALSQVRRLVPRMLMTLPEISAIEDVMAEIDELGGPSPHTSPLIRQVEVALDGPSSDMRALARELEVQLTSDRLEAWRELVEFNLVVRLRDLLEILSDCEALAIALAVDAPGLNVPLAFPIEASAARARYADHSQALIAGVTLSIALTFCCAFWILTSWQDGAAAAMMTAVSGSLFATQDDPTPSIRKFAFWSAVAVVVSGVYVFFILPKVHSFETLALVLAPTLLFFGLLIAEPQTFLIGVALGILMPSAMALQRAYNVDAEGFLNSGLAMIAGMWIAAVTTAVIRTAGAQWRAARFIQANESSLAEAANIRSRQEETYAMGLMFDRLLLLAPIVEATEEPIPDAMRQLRAGLNLINARKARAALPEGARRRLDAALLHIQRAYRRRAPLNADALAALNRAMQALRPGEGADRPALLALAGLRRCLFPGAPPVQLLPSGAR
jgi:uncharacterized membrane protein YccC